MRAIVEPLAEPVHGPVGRLVGDDDLVDLPDGGAADGAPVADLAVDGAESRHVVLQDDQQVLGVLAGTGRRDRRGFEAMLDEGLGLAFVQLVNALDDAGLNGPTAVESGEAGTLDVGTAFEPLLLQVVVLREVVRRSWLQGHDGILVSSSHVRGRPWCLLQVRTRRPRRLDTRHSAALMSQKRHSRSLGTRLGGSGGARAIWPQPRGYPACHPVQLIRDKASFLCRTNRPGSVSATR